MKPKTVLQPLSLLILALPAFLIAFVGFQPYDDEGLFLYMSQAAARGVLPYRDYLIEYGPVFTWSKQVFFSVLGYTHAASRIATLLLVLLTATCSYLLAHRLKLRGLCLLIASLAWIYASSAYFSESFHPGWLLSALLLLLALLLSYAPTRGVLSAQALVLALCLGIKPHLGVFLALALLTHHAQNARMLGLARVIALVFLLSTAVILSPVLSKYGLSSTTALTLFPYLLNALLPLCLVLYKTPKTEYTPGTYKRVLYLLILAILFSGVLYGFAFYRYGFEAMLLSLYSQPAKFYYQFYSMQLPFSSGMLYLVVLLYACCTLSLVRTAYTRAFTLVTLLLAILLIASGAPGLGVFSWPLVYVLYLRQTDENQTARLGILLIACSQFIHSFPLPAAQLHYATAVSWVLLADLLQRELRHYRHAPRHRSLALQLSVALLLLPLLRAVVLQLPKLQSGAAQCQSLESPFSQGTLPKHITVEEEYAEELCALTGYLRQFGNPQKPLATIPGFLSLPLLLGRQSPADFPAARWSYLPDPMLASILEDMPNVDHVVIHRANGRLYLESEKTAPALFDTRLMQYVRRKYAVIPDRNWLGKESLHFQLLGRTKKRTNK